MGRWVAVGVVAAVAAGCSVIGLAYNRLPTVVMWRLDSLWDLDAPQRQGLDEAARRWHRWHRRERLASGCRWLADWHAQATPEQRARAASQLQAYERDIRALIPNGGPFNVSLSRGAASGQ